MTIVCPTQPCGKVVAMHAGTTTTAARSVPLAASQQPTAHCKSTAARSTPFASALSSHARWSTLTVHASDRPAPTTTTPASSSTTRGLDYTTHEGNSWMASLKASGAGGQLHHHRQHARSLLQASTCWWIPGWLATWSLPTLSGYTRVSSASSSPASTRPSRLQPTQTSSS